MSTKQSKEEKWKDPNWLRTKYIEERKSLNSIAEETTASMSTIHNWMDKYGIDRRSRSEANYNKSPNELSDKKWLYEQFYGEGRSVDEIATCLNVSPGTVRRRINHLGVQLIFETEPDVYAKLSDPEWLREQYLTFEKSTYTIASELGVHEVTVARWMDYCGIERKTRINEQHHNYTHGLYSVRRRVRFRDQYRCQCCGISEYRYKVEFGVRLDTHHIVPVEEFEDESNAHTESNMVVLCVKCHRNLEGLTHEQIIQIIGYPFQCGC